MVKWVQTEAVNFEVDIQFINNQDLTPFPEKSKRQNINKKLCELRVSNERSEWA